MSVVFTGPLRANLATFNAKAEARLHALFAFQAPRIEAHARQSAPWKDQTGNARRGLTAIHAGTGHSFEIVLFHRAPYGIWLEVRWSGKYAVILPSIGWGGAEIMASLPSVFAAAATP